MVEEGAVFQNVSFKQVGGVWYLYILLFWRQILRPSGVRWECAGGGGSYKNGWAGFQNSGIDYLSYQFGFWHQTILAW